MTDVGRVGIWSAQLRRSRAAEIVAASAELESLGPSHAVVVERLNQTYLALPNYRRHLLRVGLREDDLDGDGSDRLVDTVVAWGDDDIVHTRIAEFRDAGADHVCLQVLTADPERMPMTEWRALAASMNA